MFVGYPFHADHRLLSVKENITVCS